MRKITLSLFALAYALALGAQQDPLQVISNAGGVDENDQLQWSWTLGHVGYERRHAIDDK